MAKYYNVNLYRITIDWTMEKTEEWVSTEIVKKGLFFAKSLSGRRYKIVGQNYLEDENYEYTDVDYDIENERMYYPDYEGQIRDPYEEGFVFSERLVVKKEEFIKENEISSLELEQHQNELLKPKQRIKSRFKK